jgi:F-type H+-transporting ATPase subunit a
MHGAHEVGHAAEAQSHNLAHQLHERWPWLLQAILPQSLWGFEWIFVSLGLVALLSWVGYSVTRRIAFYPRGMQNVLEMIYEWLEDFTIGILGEQGRPYVALIGTIFLYILSMNLIGIVPGLVSPTSDANCTIAMAVSVVVTVQCIAIAEIGFKSYFLHLCGEPLWMAPLGIFIHGIGEFLAKPLSLAVRLFGNIYGEDQVIVNLTALGIGIFQSTWLPIPVQFPLLVFGLFTSLVQALVFAMLTAIYIALFISGHDHGEHGEHGEHKEDHHGHKAHAGAH